MDREWYYLPDRTKPYDQTRCSCTHLQACTPLMNHRGEHMANWLNEVSERSSAFLPHGHYYLWIPSLLWMHVVSDALR